MATNCVSSLNAIANTQCIYCLDIGLDILDTAVLMLNHSFQWTAYGCVCLIYTPVIEMFPNCLNLIRNNFSHVKENTIMVTICT